MFDDILEEEVEVTWKEIQARLPLIPKKRDRKSLEKMINLVKEEIKKEKRDLQNRHNLI